MRLETYSDGGPWPRRGRWEAVRLETYSDGGRGPVEDGDGGRQ